MNTLISEGESLTNEIIGKVRPRNVSTIICPPFTHLSAISAIVKDVEGVHLGAQDCSPYHAGAYTGQNPAAVLKDIGVEYVIIGHSERRNYQGENDEIAREKIKSAINHGLKIIFWLFNTVCGSIDCSLGLCVRAARGRPLRSAASSSVQGPGGPRGARPTPKRRSSRG